MLDAGAQSVGEARECHAIAVDARAPKFDGGIVTRLDCLPLGIVVNAQGQRFYDEGEDVWPKRYAIWGKLIARQPGQIAFSIVDAKSAGAFMPSVFPPIVANSIPELAGLLRLPAGVLSRRPLTPSTARCARGRSNLSALDDCRTEGLGPEQDALGPAARYAALLGVSASSRHHVHVSRAQSGRTCACADVRRGIPRRTSTPPER